MTAAALALLEDDPIARRLVAAWPQVGAWKDDGAALTKWSRLSAVKPKDILRRKDMLFGNEICFLQGGVDKAAESYVAQIAMGKLSRTAAPRKPKEKKEKEKK